MSLTAIVKWCHVLMLMCAHKLTKKKAEKGRTQPGTAHRTPQVVPQAWPSHN